MINKIVKKLKNYNNQKFNLNNDQIKLIKRLIDDHTDLINRPTTDIDIDIDLNEKRKDLILLWQIYAGVLESQM